MRVDVAGSIDVLADFRITFSHASLDGPQCDEGSVEVGGIRVPRPWFTERFGDAMFPLGLLIADTMFRKAPQNLGALWEVVLTTYDQKFPNAVSVSVDASQFRWAMSDDEAISYFYERVIDGASQVFPFLNRALLKRFLKGGRRFVWKNELSDDRGRAVLTHIADPTGYRAELEVDGTTFAVHRSPGALTDWQPLFGKFELKARTVEISAKPSQPIRNGKEVGATGTSKKPLKFVVSRGEKPTLVRRFFDGWDPAVIPETRVSYR